MGGQGWATWALACAAVVCNACAQVMMKQAHVVDAADWRQWLSVPMAAALAAYGVSFGLTALVFARLPLSLASPLMAGAIFVLVSIASVLLFGESVNASRAAGIVLIVAGIFLLARSS